MNQETIPAGAGASFEAYVARPTRPNGHAVIVLQEIFGVTKQVRGVADRFAEDGYLAYAPDLFWRLEPGVQLSHSKDDLQRAFVLLERYRDEDGLADIVTTAKHIRALPDFRGKVAAAGLCMGGKLAFLAATLNEVDAAVAYYGVGIEKRLDAAAQLCRPLQMHFGGTDPYVTDAARAAILDAVGGEFVEAHVYAEATHGFYTRGAQSDIDLARKRTNQFLQKALQG